MRRFVTYLYEYDKGNRGKNCGFVRVDVRKGEVRMEVHMRNCLRCGEKGTIYILVEDEEQIFGIEMGDVAVSNGRGERTLQFDENNMEESGYEFDEIIGIGIRCENGGYLASNWEDENYEALTWGNFSIIGSQKIPLSSEDVRPMPIPSEIETSLNSSMSPWTESQTQMPFEYENENLLSMPSYQETTESMQSGESWENATDVSMPLYQGNANQMQTQEELEHSISSFTMPYSEMKKSATNMPQYDESGNEMDNSMSQQKETEKVSKSRKPWWYAQMASLLQTEVLSDSQTKEISCPKSQIVPQAECFIQTSMEQSPPKICTYRKITVSDIRNLPSPNWYLCNNNFLLHGFFNYDYLIIKKEKSDNREKFYLGVPGVFEKQEKAMAMMFGFPFFESCSPEELDTEQEFEQREKPKEPKEGDFGCWYLVLNI